MRVPKYCRQREKFIQDRAYVKLHGKRIQLGDYGTKESRAEYDRLIAEWLANHRLPPVQASTDVMRIEELVARFLLHAETYYGGSGELGNYRDALRPLIHLYGTTAASDFGPTALKALRQWMIEQKLCRNYINRQIKRVVRTFKWGVENELIDAAVHQRLAAVDGLRKNRSSAQESEPVVPVTQEQVDAVRPFLSREVEALVDLQDLTGARSGELLKLRPIDIQTGEDTWTYSPAKHKTAHHGEKRIIEFGPKAQAILREFMAGRAMDARLFDSHDRNSYRIAIARACDRAFPPPERLARLRVPAGGRKKLRRETREEWRKRLGPAAWAEVEGWRDRHRWHPHQLRHAFATRIRALAGLETAQIATGHKKMEMTLHYAKADRAAVTALLKKIG